MKEVYEYVRLKRLSQLSYHVLNIKHARIFFELFELSKHAKQSWSFKIGSVKDIGFSTNP